MVYTRAGFNPKKEVLIIDRVDNGTLIDGEAQRVAGIGSIELALDRLGGKDMSIGWVHYTDPTTGTMKHVRVAFTPPVSDADESSIPAGAPEITIGGSGGGLLKLTVDSIDLVAGTITGHRTENGVTVSKTVLLPTLLRRTTPETFGGVTSTFSNYVNATQSRTITLSGGSTGTANECISPPYRVGDDIFYMSSEVGLIDINVDGRAWVSLAPIV